MYWHGIIKIIIVFLSVCHSNNNIHDSEVVFLKSTNCRHSYQAIQALNTISYACTCTNNS